MKAPPPLTYIRSFECAGRHLSFTVAAKELGYTQAAISTHIRALEQYIGHKLFVRYPRHLKLTEVGVAFLLNLRQSLDQIDRATEALVTSARKRIVVISCPASLAENWLAECMAKFSQKHPEIELLIHGSIWENIDDVVADITITSRRSDDPQQSGTNIFDEKLVLLCAPQMLMGTDAIRVPDDIRRFKQINVLGRQEYWRDMGQALDIKFTDKDKNLTTNAWNIAFELAVTGGSCVVAQLSLASIYISRGLLVEPFPIRPKSPWNYYVIDSSAVEGKTVNLVRDWILASANPLIP